MDALDAYRGRTVVLTGHTGFKGSWLALWLTELGARVVGFALPPEEPSLFEACDLRRRITSIEGDVRDLEALARVFEREQPAIVFHLAAQAIVRSSYELPKHTFDVNIGGTVNVLECIRRTAATRAAVIVTSDKCYENREWAYGYREDDPMGGHDPYSASKGAAELVVASYRRSFLSASAGRAFGLATGRAGNVIGGGDFARDRIVPDCVRAVTADLPVVVRNPRSIRPWQHVLEPLHGYLVLGAQLLADPVRYSGPYNFGPLVLDHVTVGELVAVLLESWGRGASKLDAQPAAAKEAGLLRLACDKAMTELGWRPRLGVRDAIAWSVEWYRAWHERAPADQLLEVAARQIARYCAAPERTR